KDLAVVYCWTSPVACRMAFMQTAPVVLPPALAQDGNRPAARLGVAAAIRAGDPCKSRLPPRSEARMRSPAAAFADRERCPEPGAAAPARRPGRGSRRTARAYRDGAGRRT